MPPRCYRNMVCIVVGLACGVAYGEELPDLIKRLEKLDGTNSIRAVVRIEDRISKTQNEKAKPLEKGGFVVTADANALTLTVAGKISDTRIFREFSVLRAGELVHYGPHLARELDGLKLIENRAGSHQGVSCRHWRLKSEQKQKKSGVSSTTVRDVELWIDTDGYPLAGSFKTQTKGRMLLFKFGAGSTRNQRYRRLGDRLILIFDKNETDIKSKAGDQKRTITTTVEVKKD